MMHFYHARTVGITLLVLFGLWSEAGAQTFGVSFSYTPSESLEPEVQLRELGAGDVTFDLRLAKSFTGPFEAGVAGRFRSSFGPLGTVALNAQADIDTSGGFDLGVVGSGALASTGLDASLSVFNRNPGAFAAPAAYTATRPFFGSALASGAGVHLSVGATQRLGRTLILEAAPELSYLSGSGFGAGLAGRLEFRRFIDQDDGALLAEVHTGPGPARTFFAGGVEYGLNRRGLPSLSAAALLGRGEFGFQPGFRAAASGELGSFSYRAELAAEPYRRDAPPYRGSVALGTELGPGALGLELGAALANDYGVAPLLLRASYGFRF